MLATFGLELGMGFQMIDDMLDYTATSEALGKKVGTDFREAKCTLPLITALSRASQEERKQILELLRSSPEIREKNFLWAKDFIEKRDGFHYTRDSALTHVEKAIRQLTCFPHCAERDALETMAHYVIERSH
jgi:octaprenyl-diphosphate synthase